MIIETIIGILYILTLFVTVCYIIAAASMLYKRKIPQEKKLPKVSVIIATKNEKNVIETTLKSIRKSDYPKIEIIVVDSSEDGTAKIARKYVDYVLTDKKSKGKPRALNIGSKKASGEILYFLDADCIVRKDTIRKLVCSMDEEYRAAVGMTVPRNADTFTAKSASLQAAWLWVANYGLSAMLKTAVVPGRNFAVYKKTLSGIGNFKDVLTEDLNISHRLYAKKQKAAFVPRAVCSELYPKKFSHYFRQQERWHAGFFAEQCSAAKELGFLRYILVVAAAALSQVHLVTLLLLILYALTNSAIFAYATIIPAAVMVITAAKLLKKQIYYLPAIFAVVAAVNIALILVSAKRALCREKIPWYKTPR